MADVSKIKLPNGNEYNIKDYRIPGVDTTPTSGSDNIVTSGGVYNKINNESLVISTALNDLNNRLTEIEGNISNVDEIPTEDSTNLVTSGGIYTAIVENELATASALNDLNERIDNVDEIVGDGTDFVKVPDYEDDQEVVARAINDLNDRVTIIEDDGIITEPFSETDPIFSASPAANITTSDITNWNNKTSNTGTVTQVNVGSTSYNPSNGVISLPAYPTTLPASDVSAWAKASTKPTYTASEVGAQEALVSGTNIKTINNESLLGSGNISITGGGEANVIEAVTFNGTPATITNKTAAITATIPSEVTESTVAGWGFTKNAGTLTTETDPVFSASAAAGITSSDITNWNGKTSNTGTVTGVKMNGTTNNPTSGVVDLGTVLTSYTETDPTVPSWAKASTKPTYTASEVGALPLAGGTMDSGAEIYLPGSSSLGETKVTRNGVSVSPNASSFSTVTNYKHGSILYSPDGMSLNTISLPAATGTIALTSDIPSAVTESTVSGWGFTKNAAPGTLQTNATTAQTASSGEAMSGTITLHKIAKTGTYSDLIGTPTIPTNVSDLTNDSGFTSNTGTITGITMNGASKGTSGVVNLGTVLTAHQDISGKANLSGAAFTGTVTGTSSGNTAQFRNITISSSEPTSSDGSNGDIWIVI